MNNIKITTTHPTVLPEYTIWGLGKLLTKPNCQLLDNVSENLLNFANKFVDDGTFKLSNIHQVSFDTYSQALTAILLRYTKTIGHINGEHISLLIDKSTNKLLGLTKQTKQTKNALPSHSLAYQKSIEFLNQHASDLIFDQHSLDLPECDNNLRLEFNPVINIDKLQLQWIDQHIELIIINNAKHVVNGMKVKFYIPNADRWAWVVVDYQGNVITFERDIHWDFDKHQRLTPMWLHDQWLVSHQIDESLLVTPNSEKY
ncbi:hypothetical protein L3V82_12905 [Thiotrichales bacterium 19S3-7]|nr:hypothetical protein [Thiotrichales bacterium 19S3-7]MCF6803072.1 hypothetical protein [Thiotrichales bacterium 19S3-11]